MTKQKLVEYLKYCLFKSTDENFIVDYRPDKFLVAEIHIESDGPRQLKYHTNRWYYFSEDMPGYVQFSRDYRIGLLTEEHFYTRDDRLEIEMLEIKTQLEKNKLKVKSRRGSIYEYVNSLKVGDRVSYKNMPGFITYSHVGTNPKKFTVNVKDTYYKYVPGEEIFPRDKEDLSHIKVPDEVRKMTTKELMSRMKELQRVGYGREIYKAELQNREHIRKTKKTFLYSK
jgi:hypothetical protein